MDRLHSPSEPPLRVFIGYDPRQPLAYNVLQHSIARHSSRPVAITPLILGQLPIKRRGLTEFTYSRFLVPWLCQFKGLALFLDADMVVKGDIAELFDNVGLSAVNVNQEQQRFEWASAMLFSCGACLRLTPEFIDNPANKLFDMEWAPSVGKFDPAWNHCVGYTPENPEAKLFHYTQGLPCWYETKGLEDGPWIEEHRAMNATVGWKDLMGGSVHARPVIQRLFEGYVGRSEVAALAED